MSHDWLWSLDTTFPSDTDRARELLDQLLEKLSELGWPEEEKFGIHLSVEEALMNAIKHGNQRDPEKVVIVDFRASGEMLFVSVEDQGNDFDPNDVPDPTLDENLELPSGRGLMLMRTFMNKVEYNAKGNGVVMEKTKGLSNPSDDDEDGDDND